MKKQTKKKLTHHVKRIAKRVLFVWEMVITIVFSIILIPIFVQSSEKFNFYKFVIIASLMVYCIFYLIGGQFKKGFFKDYFQTSSLRLLIAMSMLAFAFFFHILDMVLWDNVILVMAAVLYAYFLQRITFFLRVIGL